MEEVMNTRRFTKPVTVLVGLGYPYEVTDTMEAYRLLSEWPGGDNPAQAAALNACRAALAGEIEPETARDIFAAFARRSGVLVPETWAGPPPSPCSGRGQPFRRK